MKKSLKTLVVIVSFLLIFACAKKNDISLIPAENKAKTSTKITFSESFEDNINYFINNNIEAINKLKKGEILPCNSVCSLLHYELKKYDEDICLNVVKLAVESNGNLQNSLDMSSPLIESCERNFYKLTDYLLTTVAKEDINYPFSTFGPPLYYAIKNGNIELIELLLKNGADPNGKTSFDIDFMEHIDSFITNKTISEDTGEKIKKILINYGYTKNIK